MWTLKSLEKLSIKRWKVSEAQLREGVGLCAAAAAADGDGEDEILTRWRSGHPASSC